MDDVQEITRREDAFYAALTASDVAGLDEIMSNELTTFVHSTGVVDTKSQYLDAVRSGRYAHGPITRLHGKTKVFPGAAVTVGVIDMVSLPRGGTPGSMRLLQVLVWGVAYAKAADHTCSATTLRARRDEWITAGVFTALEQICLDAYDRVVGLELFLGGVIASQRCVAPRPGVALDGPPRRLPARSVALDRAAGGTVARLAVGGRVVRRGVVGVVAVRRRHVARAWVLVARAWVLAARAWVLAIGHAGAGSAFGGVLGVRGACCVLVHAADDRPGRVPRRR